MEINFATARDIFNAAVDKPGGERSLFLDEACNGDLELRRHVDQLLEAHDQSACFLDHTAFSIPTLDQPLAERPGTVIGPYKLLQQIGEGGFGVVFVAEQDGPVRRRVALKVIKPGMDTREVIARFEAERQALAMMDHPLIARVYDAGATENGRPYFVMELVQGVPITEYCDRCNLTTDDRLGLFILVCRAVQHAHQKGVIHRDIKPSNVLIAIQDGQPVPKIIDFGVAKAINQQLTERTLLTAFAQIVGTPLYMSPEQAELSPLGVDTRSDIYSLGVLLYELLTGTTPFDKGRFQSASYDELRRIIREEEPPRPSARISTLDAELATTIADHRRTDVSRLRQKIHGDLDWIVMKCLEKDRNRRYDSAGSLARDVERFLGNEPVHACPPSVGYRLKKFVWRNKAAAAFVGLLLISVAGLGVSNVVIKKERDAKTAALTQATQESSRAKAVSDLLQEMLRSANVDEAKGSQYTVPELLDKFASNLGAQLSDQPAVEAEIRATVGSAYSSLKLPHKAQPHIERALALRRQLDGTDLEGVAALLVTYAWNLEDQQRYSEAEVQLREALEIYRRKGVTGTPVIRVLAALEQVLISMSRGAEAERLIDEAKSIASSSVEDSQQIAGMLRRYANLKIKQGRFAEAEQLANQSIKIHRSLPGDQSTGIAWGLLTISDALMRQNKLDTAERTIRESLDIFRRRYPRDHQNVRRATSRLRSILASRGDKSALDSLVQLEAEEESNGDRPGYYAGLAWLLSADPSLSSAANDVAHQLVRRAIKEYAQVAVDFPDDLDRRLDALKGYIEIAEQCADKPDFAPEVDEAHRRLTDELAALLATFSESVRCQKEVGHRHRGWAFAVQWNPKYAAQAEHHFQESIKFFAKVARDNPEVDRTQLFLANTHAFLGDALWRSGKSEQAGKAFEQALEIYSLKAADIAESPTEYSTAEKINAYFCIANFLAATHKEQQAAELIREVALETMKETDPNALADGLYYLAVAQLKLGDRTGYQSTCKALAEVPFGKLEGLTKMRPIWTPCIGPDALEDPTLPVKLAEDCVANQLLAEPHYGTYLLGTAHYRAGQFKQAADRLVESIATYPTSPVRGHDTLNYQRLLLAMTQWQLGERDRARKLLTETLPDVDKELKSAASSWNRRATLELLRAEAEALIGTATADEAVKNGKPSHVEAAGKTTDGQRTANH